MARLLVGLYPLAWRERYGREMEALIEDDPPNLGGVASLLMGAADAHLRPAPTWASSIPPVTRMRLSIGAIFCCWIVLSLNGIGFQKDTEDPDFAAAATRHPLLAIAHDVVVAGALLGGLAIALGGLPLLWQAVRHALRERDGRLMLLLLSPALALVGFGALSWLLFVTAPARHGQFPLSFVVFFQAPWRLAGWACAAVCALAPRWVLARIELSPRALRRASRAGAALATATVLIASALIVYVCVLALQAGKLSAQSTAPVGASTGAMLALYAAMACLASVLALAAAKRASRAARAR